MCSVGRSKEWPSPSGSPLSEVQHRTYYSPVDQHVYCCHFLLLMGRNICSMYDKGRCSKVSVYCSTQCILILSCPAPLYPVSQCARVAGMPALWWMDSSIITFRGENILRVPSMQKTSSEQSTYKPHTNTQYNSIETVYKI